MSPLWRSPASRTGLLLIASVLLVMSGQPRWFSSSAIVLPPVSESLYTPAGAWQAPLARIPGIEAVSRWPWLAYAVVAGCVITSVSRLRGWTVASVLIAFALSLGIEPLHVVPAAALLALGFADESSGSKRPAFIRFLWIGLAILLSVLGTLEFGLVLFVAVGIVLNPQASSSEVVSSRRRNGWIAIGGILLVAGAALIFPGFQDCLLRPVNWVSASLHPELLPKLSPAYRSLGDWQTGLLLGGLAIAWLEMARGRTIDLWRLIPMSALTVLGVGCEHYLWLSTFAVAMLSRGSSSRGERSSIARAGTAGAVAFALVVFAARTDWMAFLAGDASAVRIDVSGWKLRGPVMLLDLDKSLDWQSSTAGKWHRLVIDDRWDIHGDNYDEYAQVCHDVRHARQHSYLRTDGSWGGYAQWLKSWDPILLVADPMDDVGLRRLSLSPDWRIMGMDGAQVVFGRSGNPTTLPVMNAALNCLLTLEWPANVDQLNVDATIVAPSPEDRRTAAGVLCAMRLPYAALRFLRGDECAAADRQRTACFVELAHRVNSHSGTPSLLDQFRAVTRIRRLRDSADVSERRRLAHHLMSLGLNDLSRQLFPDASPNSGTEPEVAKAKETSGWAGDDKATDPGELRMREALASGDADSCRKLLADLSEQARSYYSIFLNAPVRSAEQLRDDFGTFLSSFPDADAAMRAEALFYQGCAALEAGDTGQAILSFRQSEQLAPNLPQRAIRRTFLVQLAAPGNRATGRN